jgi:acylphosphatase
VTTDRTERRAYRLNGRVQGVGFRWWTRQTASELGVRGTVRNARDGSVEIRAEGDAPLLDRFEDRLRDGPPAARVVRLEREEPGREELPAGFEIIH